MLRSESLLDLLYSGKTSVVRNVAAEWLLNAERGTDAENADVTFLSFLILGFQTSKYH